MMEAPNVPNGWLEVAAEHFDVCVKAIKCNHIGWPDRVVFYYGDTQGEFFGIQFGGGRCYLAPNLRQ